jgi:hypothetical protein
MAFPKNPSDYDEHVERHARFYALGGLWSRRGEPEGCHLRQSDVGTPQTWLPGANMPRASQMMIVNAVYETIETTNIYIKIHDINEGAWIPKTKFDDPSGFSTWGTGGVSSTNFGKSDWGDAEFFVLLRHSTRDAKAGRPQRVRLVFLRVAANKTMMAWENHSQVRDNDFQLNSFAKVDINVDIENMVSLAFVPESGHFKNINITTEVY